MSADTVITSGSSPSPNPAPSPLPIDLTYVLAAASAHAAGALDAKNAAIAAKNSADADASATAADRSATHTDRVAADADALATAADRVQTGLDRAAVNTAKTDTLAAKDLAVSAKDTAVTNAGAAASDRAAVAALLASFRNVLLGAFANDAAAVAFAAANGITVSDGLMYENTVADKFRIYTGAAWADYDASAQQQSAAASISATNAAAAQAAAETARDGAVTAKNAADADAVATAADRVQTGLDRTAAAGSATAAASSAASAVTAQTASESARDLTLGYKSSTQTLFDSVSAQALTVSGYATSAAASAAASAASASAVSGLSNLSAAAKAIVTASDATVLADIETGRDTHEWRSKVASVSHQTEALNTSTRGARAQYPSRGKLVGRTTANTLSVIDFDDPTTPLWKAWTVAGITSALYTQGKIYYGGTGGVYEIDLILDAVWKRDTSGLWSCNQNVANYNQSTAVWTLVSASGAIASVTVNDISAAVTPLTPLNPLRCGLPNPTLAVATMAGVSVIRADGAVVNVTHTNGGYTSAYKVSLTPDVLAFTIDGSGRETSRYSVVIPVPAYTRTVSMASGSLDALVGTLTWGAVSPNPLMIGSNVSNGIQSMQSLNKRSMAFGSSLGLSILMRDPANPANSAIAYVTTTCNTGYMAGLTKLALAESSAALSNMVGGTASDQSGAGNNPTVTGTLVRSVVASGAELAAYGGFSASNYMERGYSAAFDPGTGDVQVMAEVVLTSAIAKQVTFVDRIPSGGGSYYRLDTDSSGKPRFTVSDSTNTATALAPVALPAGAHCIRGIRRAASSRIEIEVDGVIVATASASAVGSLNDFAVLRIGQAVAGGAPMDIAGPGIARVHVSMSAPTSDQIAAWWTAHAPQFAANAKCLLVGSTNVQGLAYDVDTGQTAIPTDVGTNVFKELTRVGYISVAGVADSAKLSNDNHKAVAFSGGDLVIASAAQVYGSLLATSGLREIAKRRASVPPYDPTWGIFNGVTTDATPTIIASTPILEGRAYRFRATVAAVRYGGTATEKAVYDVTGLVTRDIGGNAVVVSTTTTVSEVTSSMDCVAQANTTAQTLEIKATGKASTRLAWCVELEFYDIGLMGAAA